MAIRAPPPTTATRLTNSRITGPWPEAELAKGDGFIADVTYQSRHRHTIQDGTGQYHRFHVLIGSLSAATKRKFDQFGVEIPPTIVPDKKISTGYLQSSYVKKEGDRPDAISIDDALKIVNRARSLVSLEPLKGDTFEFWGPEEVLKSFEFSSGDKIRITTKGDSFFIEAITISDGAKPSSFRGDVRVGQNWTDKLLQVKAQDEDGPLPQDKMEGVADDEWD